MGKIATSSFRRSWAHAGGVPSLAAVGLPLDTSTLAEPASLATNLLTTRGIVKIIYLLYSIFISSFSHSSLIMLVNLLYLSIDFYKLENTYWHRVQYLKKLPVLQTLKHLAKFRGLFCKSIYIDQL